MRDCYKKFWKEALAEKMSCAFPMFALKETPSRKAGDDLQPSSKPVLFIWNPAKGLKLSIEFVARGKGDSFGADCVWDQAGAGKQPTPSWLSDAPFREEAFALPHAKLQLQCLSRAWQDNPRVLFWHFWEPSTELLETAESHAAWKAEFIAEELRQISDFEARQRVQTTVNQAMHDLRRCAMPWFEKKLEWYESVRGNG